MKTAALLLLATAAALHADAFTVTNANATGAGSLYAVLDFISFLPADSAHVVEFDAAYFGQPRIIRLSGAGPSALTLGRSITLNGPPLISGKPSLTITGDVNANGVSDAGDVGAIACFSLVPGRVMSISRIAFDLCAAAAPAGGISTSGDLALTVEDCTFTRCGLNGAMTCDHTGSTVIRRCSFRDNRAQEGGAVNSRQTTPQFEQCQFTGNAATAQTGVPGGGAVRADAGAFFTDCLFAGNTAGWGGAVFIVGGTLDRCTFTGNTATTNGGAIQFHIGSVSAHVTNCTFHANSSGGAASAVMADAMAELTHCTFSGNHSNSTGAALTDTAAIQGTANIVLTNCLAAGNPAGPARSSAPDVLGNSQIISGGGNLIGIWTGSDRFNDPGDQTGTLAAPLAAGIGPLQNNGGLTPTCAPLKDSLAINHALDGNTVTDQRGLVRPAGSAPDSGAVEFKVLNYAQWSALYAFADGQSGQNDDADGDGARNLLEYFTGSDPLRLSPSVLTVKPAGNQFRMTYPVADHVPTNLFRPAFQISQNLTGWSPSTQTPVATGQDGNTTRYEVFFNATIAKRFARMYVEQVPPN